jgi:HK97 family phage prohead protease
MKLQLRSQIGATITSENNKLVGRAIVWNSLSQDLGGFKERFLPGSVTDSVRGGQIAALFNHDTSKPLATQTNGTLRLLEDSEGLQVEIDLPDTSYANDLRSLMKRGDGTGMSFGFSPIDVNWVKENGINIAEVRKAELGEVSPLLGVQPAYQATSIALRSLNDEQIDYVDTYGIDVDQLAGVFISIKKGFQLSDKERDLMQQARSLFALSKYPKPALQAACDKAAKILI